MVGACSNNLKTAGTDSLVIKALAFPLLCPEYDGKALREIVDDIRIPYTDSEFFYNALSYVSYDMDEAGLLELLDEAEKIEHDIKSGGIQND